MAGKTTAASAVVRQAEAMGWTVRFARGSDHVMIRSPNGVTATFAYNRGENRSVANMRANLRRIGFYDALAAHEAAEERRRRKRIAAARNVPPR